MSKEQDVINYYVLCNKLKNVIRTGWLDWKVQKNRLESIAEHIYGGANAGYCDENNLSIRY